MAGVRAGGDRQLLHERIRLHSLAAAEQVKSHGRPNDLIDRLRQDAAFAATNFEDVLRPQAFIGRAPQQIEHFVENILKPIRQRFAGQFDEPVELKV